MGKHAVKRHHDDTIRAKIQASQIINRLQAHINGELELSNTQVTAAKILLSKTCPDLAAITHKGDENSPINTVTTVNLNIIDPK